MKGHKPSFIDRSQTNQSDCVKIKRQKSDSGDCRAAEGKDACVEMERKEKTTFLLVYCLHSLIFRKGTQPLFSQAVVFITALNHITLSN